MVIRVGIWVGARVVGGLVIVFGLLALVGASWFLRGTDDATRLFQLLQGVILGTLGWLYGTQGFEAARQAAAREELARRETARDSESLEEENARLEQELDHLERALRLLRDDPALQQKVDEAVRRVSE